MAIIGIDLGTTNSLGSVYRNGNVDLIPNAYGSFMTPSVIAVKPDGQLLTGLPAKKYQLEHPDRAVSLVYPRAAQRRIYGKPSEIRPQMSGLRMIRKPSAGSRRHTGS